jgi:hypothetical protein
VYLAVLALVATAVVGGALIVRVALAALANGRTQHDVELLSDVGLQHAFDHQPEPSTSSSHYEANDGSEGSNNGDRGCAMFDRRLAEVRAAVALDGGRLADRIAFLPASLGLLAQVALGVLTIASLSLRLLSEA